ncbi:flagellin [Candidatus Liberibacter americanus]|uniref:Flagellin n=1 Tax=Candidatus Liberibacter americanus str. Sao Paulo TaxID=1261131 RepID=U6B7C6_9HYPH|nr:flagellin [Candidatus Liberibacter americanus]AHA27751.1 Flagellin protein [Candidatus Liberibacter americanus str. Sao Paulo]EMS36136.1 flagellin domain-containing protein [Candidatus Liberibacter americanus PW_SP]
MTSILTNIPAMSASQKLRDINHNLDVVQGRVSSGLRVADAADNAAYWSIAKGMKSDSAALSAISDAIGLGASKVDIAKAGMEKTVEVLSNMKSKLVASIEHGTDAHSVQEEITQLQDQLKGIASGASFNGENWLQANLGSSTAVVNKSVVSSFVREDNGDIYVTNIEYKLDSDSVLFDKSNNSDRYGILDKKAEVKNVAQSVKNVSFNILDKDGNIKKIDKQLATASGAWLKGAKATFDQNKGVAVVDPDSTSTAVSGSGSTSSAKKSDVDKVYLLVGEDTWVLATKNKDHIKLDNGNLLVAMTKYKGDDYYVDISETSVKDKTTYNVSLNYSVTDFDITSFSNTDMYNQTTSIQKMLDFVDKQLKNVTAAAGKIGSISSRIHLQEDFVQFMRDSIEKGIGRLVDADMASESSKLSALQTQQQLAIQSLSIANSTSQRILSLFR